MPALSPKAILEGRTSNRAPMSLIIGLVVTGVCAFVALLVWVWQGGVDGVLIGFVCALPTYAVLAGLLLLINRLDPEPPLNLLLAVGWGAGLAILGGFFLNSGGEMVMAVFVGPQAAESASAAILAPIVEESLKGSLLLFLLLARTNKAAKYIKGPTDALVYAGLCALSFAFAENILYYMTRPETLGDLVTLVFQRGILSPLCHPLFTSMTALGVAYAATHRGPGRVLAPIGGWLCAVGLHSLWNTSATYGLEMRVAYPIDFVILIVLAIVLVQDRKKLIGHIRTYLPAYIPSGLVLPHDIDMLSAMPARRQARRWARANSGMVGARAMADYQLAATELALLHEHAANGVVEQLQFLSRQAQIVGLMRAAQDAFFRRTPQRVLFRRAPMPQRPVAPPSWAARPEQSGFFAPPTELKTTRLPTAQFAAEQAPQRRGAPPPPPRARPTPPQRPAASPPTGGPAPRPPAQSQPTGWQPPRQQPPGQQPPRQQGPRRSGPGR